MNFSSSRPHTSASSLARWWLNAGRPSLSATMSSLNLRMSGKRAWDRARVSMYRGSKGLPSRSAPAVMKPMSNSALWAHRGLSPTKSKNAPMASPSEGAPNTSRSVMPVSRWMSGGMGMPGSTKVWNRSPAVPPWNTTAPISVIRSCRSERPVVSMSKAT